MQNLIIRSTQKNTSLLTDSTLQCFILDTSLPEEFLEKFTAAAVSGGKLALYSGENAADICERHGGSGFLLDTSKENIKQKDIKKIFVAHPHAVKGLICRNRRHEAMLVSECEPDFIVFKVWKDGFAENKKLLDWYNELFLIQSAAQIEDDLPDLSSLHTDFIILTDSQYKIFVAK